MREIIIVEERPWMIQDAVKDLQQRGFTASKVLYVHSIFGYANLKAEFIRKFTDETGVQVIDIKTESELIREISDLKSNENNVFFIGYRSDCNEIVTCIDYMKHQGLDNRLWLYTILGNPDNLYRITKNVLPTKEFTVWDTTQCETLTI